jgi:hypothetical protein
VDTKQGIFREIEADIVMTFQNAVQFYQWLGTHLDVIRQQMGISEDDWKRMVSNTSPHSARLSRGLPGGVLTFR